VRQVSCELSYIRRLHHCVVVRTTTVRITLQVPDDHERILQRTGIHSWYLRLTPLLRRIGSIVAYIDDGGGH